MPPLVSLSLAFLVGIAVSGAAGTPWPIELLILSALLPVAALLLWRDRRGFFAFACGAAFLLGCVRYQAALVSPRDALTHYNDAKAMTLQGIVAAPPDVRDSGTNLRVEVSRIRSGNLPCAGACDWMPVAGLVLARLPRFADYQYGDQVELSGAMRAPPSQADSSYRDYLARQDIYSLMDRPRALRLATGQGNPLYAALYALRERAHTVVTQSLPEPQSGLLSGILLGLAQDIPAPTIAAFNRTSTSHIIAISGYNILIVVGFLMSLSALFVRKRHTWLIVAVGIALYCVFVGASASVVRAGIMGILLVLGPAFGRRSMALSALALSALLMTLQSPYALWDAAFQLSFAATLGLIVMATPLTAAYEQWLFRRVPQAAVREAVLFGSGDLMVTVAATLATLPILVYDFHNLSLLSLPVNLLVLPAQPAIMFTGLLVIAGGLIHPALGQVFGRLRHRPAPAGAGRPLTTCCSAPLRRTSCCRPRAAHSSRRRWPCSSGSPRSATAVRLRQFLVQPALGVISPTLGLRLDLGDGAALEVVRVGDDAEGLSLRLSYGQMSVYFDGDGVETQDLASPPDAASTVLRVGAARRRQSRNIRTLNRSLSAIRYHLGRCQQPQRQPERRHTDALAGQRRDGLPHRRARHYPPDD